MTSQVRNLWCWSQNKMGPSSKYVSSQHIVDLRQPQVAMKHHLRSVKNTCVAQSLYSEFRSLVYMAYNHSASVEKVSREPVGSPSPRVQLPIQNVNRELYSSAAVGLNRAQSWGCAWLNDSSQLQSAGTTNHSALQGFTFKGRDRAAPLDAPLKIKKES